MSDTTMVVEKSPLEIRWTRDDCERLEAAGFLTYRYELVEGAINSMGQNTAHANMVRLLILWLVKTFGGEYFFTQTSIDVRPEDNPTNRPEPDGILLARPAETFTSDPKPNDIRLLIESGRLDGPVRLNYKSSSLCPRRDRRVLGRQSAGSNADRAL